MVLLAVSLDEIEANHVTLPTGTVADDDFLYLDLVGNHLESTDTRSGCVVPDNRDNADSAQAVQ
jgi:hypothetical protein